MREALEEFRTAIRNAGLHPSEVIVPDRKLRRFPSNGTRADRAGWYVFFDDDIPAGMFGDWRSGLSRTWRADIDRTLTAQEKAACRERREALRRERDSEDTKRRAEARRKAAAIWRGALPAPRDHPYLLKKGIGAHELRVHDGSLIVLVREGTTLQSLQFIRSDGDKWFLADGRVRGGYFVIGNGDDALCIAEGFATGASIHEATGHTVAVAFNAGNVLPVAMALRLASPGRRLIICADDDATTCDNPGLTKARAAALAVGASLAVPDFGSSRPDDATDFNDLHRHAGPEAVLASIEREVDVASAGDQDGNAWPEPKPIFAELKPVPAFDAETLLPDVLRRWIMDEAERMPCPPEFIAAGALVALGSIIGARCAIKPKSHEVPHTNVCTIQPQQVGRAVRKRLLMCSYQLTSGEVVCRSVDGRLRGPRFWWGACSAAAGPTVRC